MHVVLSRAASCHSKAVHESIYVRATWLTLRNHAQSEADSRLVGQEKRSLQGNQSIITSKFSINPCHPNGYNMSYICCPPSYD